MFLGFLISMALLGPPAASADTTCTRPPAFSLATGDLENRRAQETVFLLHGLGRTSRSMKRLERELALHGYRVHSLDLPTTHESIENLADRVSEAVSHSTHPDDRVSFVTHSLGGIVVRRYLSRNPKVNLGRVVMLAPPNEGSELADLLNRIPLVRDMAGPTRRELGTKSSLPCPGPVGFQVGVIAGTRSINPLSWRVIPGPDDGVVSVESAKVRGMSDFITVRHSHTFIMNAPDVIAQTLRFLETGTFEHEVHQSRTR
jgi:triacylglycerol lipase